MHYETTEDTFRIRITFNRHGVNRFLGFCACAAAGLVVGMLVGGK